MKTFESTTVSPHKIRSISHGGIKGSPDGTEGPIRWSPTGSFQSLVPSQASILALHFRPGDESTDYPAQVGQDGGPDGRPVRHLRGSRIRRGMIKANTGLAVERQNADW